MRKYNKLSSKYLISSLAYCFSVFSKIWTEGEFLIFDGNLFHIKGP